jgi:hypothetical protein
MLNRLGILKAARARIANPEDWCQKTLGVNGRVCAVGAIMSVARGSAGRDTWFSINEKLEQEGMYSLPHFNDTHMHEEVLALFDRFIEEEEMSLPGKSKTITVEPIKTAPPAPKETPITEPVVIPEREKIPA